MTEPSFVDDGPTYSLADQAAAAEVAGVVREVARLLDAGEVERVEALSVLADGLRGLSARVPDVGDITVREAVLAELAPSFDAAGFSRLSPFEF